MRVSELIRYSRKLLRGRRTVTALICFLPIAAELFFRSAEACFYSLLLYFGGIKPLDLFGGSEPLQTLITAGFTLVRWTAAAPLTYIAAQRLWEIAREQPLTPLTDILVSRRCIKRSLSALLWTRLAGLLALAPTAFFGITAYSLLMSRSSSASGMFLTLHACTLTLVSLGLWVSLKLSFAAVPFLLVRYPERSAFRTVLSSIGFMRGRRKVLLKLILLYAPAMAAIVTIPLALPDIMTAFALSIDIFIKEEEYREGIETDRRRRQTSNAPELPAGKRGRVQTAADQA